MSTTQKKINKLKYELITLKVTTILIHFSINDRRILKSIRENDECTLKVNFQNFFRFITTFGKIEIKVHNAFTSKMTLQMLLYY